MKRAICLFIALSLMFVLCACVHKHTWTDATCTEPRTCSKCGKTEGEPIGHEWEEATCSAPKTCLRCGKTEGKPLEHVPTEADYGKPSVCSLCGIELAPALEPDFVKYKFDHFCEVGVPYDYRTICYNKEVETVGTFTVTSYETTKGNGSDLEEKDGYEWKIVSFTVTFSDNNAKNWEVALVYEFDDYYDTRLMNDTWGCDINRVESWKVHYNGKTADCTGWEKHNIAWNKGVKTFDYTCYIQVPEGYDGAVLIITKPRWGMRSGEYMKGYFFEFCDEDTLFFRMT